MATIIDDLTLAQMRRANNPHNEPTGHFTGRCMRCGSRDLWDDETAYGCNACGGLFMTAHIPPRLVPDTPR